MRRKRRIVFGIIGLIIATVGAFVWPKSGPTPTMLFRNATEWPVLVVHEKQDSAKNYIGQKTQRVVPPDRFAPFQFAPGDVFLAAYADEPFDRNGEDTVRFSALGTGIEFVDIQADQDDALLFVTGVEFALPAP